MQLKYLKTHISISSLTADPLPDFAVITGLNGSGKTHLLKAILSGSVQIEGVSTAEIVYFNYGNFSIDPGYNATQATDKAKHDESTKKLQALNKLHQERVKRIQQATQPQLDPYEQSLWNCLYSEDICETLLDVSKWETADQDNMNGTASIIEQIKAINPSEELSSSFIRDRWDSLSKKVKTQFDETYPGYYDFISTSDGSASGCLGSKFARSDFFAFDLAVEVRQYIYQQFLNDHNEVRATRRAENVTYLTPSQFLEMHGRPPLDILNDVLNEFDCNGYRFAEPTFYPSPNQPINNTNIPLPLIHKTKGYQTTIGNLSSGEQTLLALALAVYKSRKSKISRVLLLDEVDTALHPSMTRQMLDALYGVFVEKNGMKIIMATHSPSTVALAPDDSVFLLKNSEKISLRQAAKAEAMCPYGRLA